MLQKNMCYNSDDSVDYVFNVDALYKNFPLKFDESMRSDIDTIYHVVGGNQPVYSDETYTSVFPNMDIKKNKVSIDGAGHWVHNDKQEQCIQLFRSWLEEIEIKKYERELGLY